MLMETWTETLKIFLKLDFGKLDFGIFGKYEWTTSFLATLQPTTSINKRASLLVNSRIFASLFSRTSEKSLFLTQPYRCESNDVTWTVLFYNTFISESYIVFNNITETKKRFWCSCCWPYIHTYLHRHSVDLEEVVTHYVALKKSRSSFWNNCYEWCKPERWCIEWDFIHLKLWAG